MTSLLKDEAADARLIKNYLWMIEAKLQKIPDFCLYLSVHGAFGLKMSILSGFVVITCGLIPFFVIPLSKWKWQQALRASSVGLKRPEAEVAQLFLWLFKDNLQRELWVQAVCVWYQIHAKTSISDWLEFYLCKRSVWMFFITHVLSFCYCGTQLCLKCMLKY